MAKPAGTAKSDPPATLPATVVNALPAGADIIRHVQAIEALFEDLKSQLTEAARTDPVRLARAFVVLHRLNDRMLADGSFKKFRELYNKTKTETVPEVLEMTGMPNVPLNEGFRVGTSTTWRASVKAGKMPEAIQFFKTTDKTEMVSVTINASTLSSYAKDLMAEFNLELPDDIFNVVPVDNTSVTKL